MRILFEYIKNDDFYKVKNILDTHPYLINKRSTYKDKIFPGITPLIQSILYNRPDITLLLLHYGADPNITNNHNMSPLMISTITNNINITNILLDDSTINFNLKNKKGQTALDIAIEKNYTRIKNKIIKKTKEQNTIIADKSLSLSRLNLLSDDLNEYINDYLSSFPYDSNITRRTNYDSTF